MTVAPEKLYTPEDLVRDPDLKRYELVKGRLVERRSSARSCLVGGEIAGFLGNEIRKTREAHIYGAGLGYHCFEDRNTVRFPDATVVRTERDAEIGDDPIFMPIPADLAIEVLCPTDLAMAIAEKVNEYLAAGFKLVWVVNPQARQVHIYRPDGSVRLVHENVEITGEAALPGFRCKVAAFFDV